MNPEPYKGLDVPPSTSFDDDEREPDEYDAWWADEHNPKKFEYDSDVDDALNDDDNEFDQ